MSAFIPTVVNRTFKIGFDYKIFMIGMYSSQIGGDKIKPTLIIIKIIKVVSEQ